MRLRAEPGEGGRADTMERFDESVQHVNSYPDLKGDSTRLNGQKEHAFSSHPCARA